MSDSPASHVLLRHAYEPAPPGDAARILADRMKEIAPGTQLRQWFGHHPAISEGLPQRCRAELQGRRALLDQARHLARAGGTVLDHGARGDAAEPRDMVPGIG